MANAYAFNGTNDATYKISARNFFMVVNNDTSISKIYANSASHSALISGGLLKHEITVLSASARRATFAGCTDDQQEQIVAASTAAHSYAVSSKEYVVGAPSDSTGQRFTTWFGQANYVSSDVVGTHFTTISDNDFSDFTYDCGTCDLSGVFAYVYPSQ